MSISDRDYLLRTIQQLAQLLAAVFLKRSAGKTDEALVLLEEARNKTFGPMSKALDAIDPSGVLTLLGAAEKARAYAEILAVEGDLRQDRGETRGAQTARRRALEIYRAVEARFPEAIRPEDRSTMEALAAR